MRVQRGGMSVETALFTTAPLPIEDYLSTDRTTANSVRAESGRIARPRRRRQGKQPVTVVPVILGLFRYDTGGHG